MYGHLTRRIDLTLHRLGRQVDIHNRSEGSKDGFNNPSDSYPDSGDTVLCVRSYPNRNTEIGGTGGDLHRDRPIFFFKKEDVPDEEARIVYPEDADSVDGASNTTTYEMKAPTVYDTHVEMFGEIVTNQ